MWLFSFADTGSDTPTPKPEPGDPSESPEVTDKTAKASTAPADLQPLEDEPQEEEASVGEEVGATMIAMMPWAISVLFHAGLVLLAIFIVWSTIVNVEEEEVIVPLVNLSATPGVPLEVTQRQKMKKESSSRKVSKVTKPEKTSLVKSRVDMKTTLIGVTGASGAKGTPFGANIGVGSGFKTSFFGSGGNARRIAFLVDASGSLIDTLPFVILELKRTIQKLSEKQAFTVIFFQGDSVIEVPPSGLKKATGETKTRVSEWIDPSQHNVHAGGKTNPLKAIQTALRYRPQLLFILSDNITGSGQYQINQDRLITEIERANKSKTKINTIQFLYPDPLSNVPGKRGTLELIAERTGGIYKFVDARELNIR